MQKQYELVIAFDSDLDEAAVKAQLAKVESVVQNHTGQVLRSDIWGRRPLAYSIRKKSYAVYAWLVVCGDNTLVSDLGRQLRISESVLRFLVVKKDKFAPDYNPRSRYEGPAAPVSAPGEEEVLAGDFPAAKESEEELGVQ